MTIQESRTHDLLQAACKHLTTPATIDWEQRRWDLYVRLAIDAHSDYERSAILQDVDHIIDVYRSNPS